MPTPAHVSMPGAPGAHPPCQPTLEQRAALDRQFAEALSEHAVARAYQPESPSQDWPRPKALGETAQAHRTRRAGHELAEEMAILTFDEVDFSQLVTAWLRPRDGELTDVIDCAERFELGGAL